MAKIMQINITCGKGSTGDIAARLYHASAKEGYEARFAFTAFEPTIDTAFRIETKPQHYLRRAMNRYFGRKQKHSSFGTRRLLRYIEREKPELIHLHNVQQNSVNYEMLFEYLGKTDIPVVYTLHDCWSFTGGCFHFFTKGCEKYAQDGCAECQVPRDDVAVSPSEAYAHKKDKIGGNDNIYPICVSEWLREAASRSYMGSMKHQPTVIYNGVDTKIFRPAKSDLRERIGIKEDEFVVLGVASYWTKEKGLPYFEELSERLPEGYRVVLAGHGLEEAAAKHKRLVCLPPTESREALAELYSSADVYVNFSLEETFGLTTAEALACGTPAIVFDTTACPEVIDSESGACVHYQNDREAELCSVMSEIQKIKAKGKAAYSTCCTSRVKSHFTTEKMAEAYLSLYRRVLSEHQEEDTNDQTTK